MKKLAILFLLYISLINNLSAQTIGIVYNINPIMGYADIKGIFKPEILNQYDLEFNLIYYIQNHLDEKKMTNKIFSDFDFNKLEYFAERVKYKKMVEYAENYCILNNLDRIIIIRKNNAYRSTDPMKMFHDFEHDFGIAALNIDKKRPWLFYNFNIINYTRGSNDFRPNFGNNIKTHKFNEVVFDVDKLTLKNNGVLEYYISVLKEIMDKGIENFLIQ